MNSSLLISNSLMLLLTTTMNEGKHGSHLEGLFVHKQYLVLLSPSWCKMYHSKVGNSNLKAELHSDPSANFNAEMVGREDRLIIIQ